MIFIKEFTKITDEKYIIGYIHNMPFDATNGLNRTEEQLLQEGKLVEVDTKPVAAEGKEPVMYYNPNTNRCFWELVDIPKSIEQNAQEQIEELKQSIAELTVMIATPTA